jgi:MFS family permease
MFFAGGLLSGYLFSYFSNRLGRRPMLIITMAMAATSVLICAFAQSIEMFIVGYFFTGFSLFGY